MTPRDVIPLKRERAGLAPMTGERMTYGVTVARNARLFTYRTRYYLRRRAWRYFRRLGYRDPTAYVSSVARALVAYEDADLQRGENILDSWGLMRVCFGRHEVLEFGATHIRLKEGRALAELSPAPRFPDAWKKSEAAALLLLLAADSHSRLVRIWAMQLFQSAHANFPVPLETILRLLDHEDAEVQQFAAKLLETSAGLGALPVAAWLKLLETRNEEALQRICDVFAKHVASDRLELRQCVELACVQPGRGVSGGLADRRANVEKLQRLRLPVLATPADLAKALDVSIPRLRWQAFHAEASAVTHYVRFQVPKKSGGMRELSAPHLDLGRVQRWILMHVLEKIPVHDAAQGFAPGRSTMNNAIPHVGRFAVVNLDLKDFFSSITFPRVKGIFQGLGFSPAVATILALVCTECPRRKVEYAGRIYHAATGPRSLPQGACTSPALSNLLARRLDARLDGLAKKVGFTCTRYADDLTFSGGKESAAKIGYLLSRVRHIVAGENLTVNEAKTRVQRPNARQTVTGIVVNRRPNVPRRTARRLRAILHHAKKEGLATQNRQNRDNFVDWLGGMIAYVQMVNPDRGRRLREEFAKIAK